MKRLAQALSFLALAATLLPPVLFFADSLTLAQDHFWLLLASIVGS
jgi:hypothetical protein